MIVRALALVFALLFPLVAAADELLTQAKAFLEADKPGAAYELLVPEQSARAGDPEYDYLLGIAALDSGRPSAAIFAFERVLSVQPDHKQARAERARAHFALGEREAARREFETVRRMGVSPEVDAAISKYLEAIERSGRVSGTQLGGYIEAGIGHDSNVNAATAESSIAVPAFGGALLQLVPSAVRQSAAFARLSGGASVNHALSRDTALFGTIDGSYRWNESAREFDQGQVSVGAGASQFWRKHIFTLGLQGDELKLDGGPRRTAYGGVAQWRYNFDARTQTTVYGQYAQLRYPGQEFRDADRYVVGAGFARGFRGAWQPVGYASAYTGTEREENGDFPWVGHRLAGARLGGELSFGPRTKALGSLGVERRRYRGDDPFFLLTRRDTQLDAIFGLEWSLGRDWRITPTLQYTRNDSNIVIHDFERTVVSVAARRLF